MAVYNSGICDITVSISCFNAISAMVLTGKNEASFNSAGMSPNASISRLPDSSLPKLIEAIFSTNDRSVYRL